MGSIHDTSHENISVPWHRLRAWIDAQEALERDTGKNQLSKLQLSALSQLISFAVDEPYVGGQDHVSNLMLLIQSRGMTLPIFKDDEPIIVPVEGALVPRWRCTCTLSMSRDQFPREGFGFEAGEKAPYFQSKKNAKQFAAQQALAFLSGQSGRRTGASSPIDRKPKTPSPSIPQPVSPQKRAAPPSISASPITKPFSRATITGSPTPTPLATPPIAKPKEPKDQKGTRESSSEESSGPDIFLKVAVLAAKIGLDNPTYKVEADGDSPTFYRGRALFKNGARVPLDLGVVNGVLGKRQAKEQIAEEVLMWLEKEVQTKEDSFRSLFR